MPRVYFNIKGSPDIQIRTGNRTIPLVHKVYHSPTGMTWGYMGSGPHDTARSILYDYYRHIERCSDAKAMHLAERQEHEFCIDFIAGLEDGWEIQEDAIQKWTIRHPLSIP